jgi:hypothetical protein
MRGRRDIYHGHGGGAAQAAGTGQRVRSTRTLPREARGGGWRQVALLALFFVALAALTVISVRCAPEDAVHRGAPQGSSADP